MGLPWLLCRCVRFTHRDWNMPASVYSLFSFILFLFDVKGEKKSQSLVGIFISRSRLWWSSSFSLVTCGVCVSLLFWIFECLCKSATQPKTPPLFQKRKKRVRVHWSTRARLFFFSFFFTVRVKTMAECMQHIRHVIMNFFIFLIQPPTRTDAHLIPRLMDELPKTHETKKIGKRRKTRKKKGVLFLFDF